MPIEYTISYDCPVKRALGGAEAFRTACTWRLLAKAAKKEAREQDLSFREVQVTHRFVTLDGLTEITEPLLNLMEEAEKLGLLEDTPPVMETVWKAALDVGAAGE